MTHLTKIFFQLLLQSPLQAQLPEGHLVLSKRPLESLESSADQGSAF